MLIQKEKEQTQNYCDKNPICSKKVKRNESLYCNDFSLTLQEEVKNYCDRTTIFDSLTLQTTSLFEDSAVLWSNSLPPDLKESTRNKYFNLLNNYILPYYGKRSLNQITYEFIEQQCNLLLVTGGRKKGGLSPKTVADSLAVVRNILRYCKNRGIPIPCDGTAISIKQKPTVMRILNRREQFQLCQYIFRRGTLKDIGVLLALYTGIRIGELCALRWENISLQDRTLFINHTLQRIQDRASKKTRIVITSPKSVCSIRTIPIPESLADIMVAYKCSNSSFFLTGCEDRYIEPRLMEAHFHKLLLEAEIKDANFHALRHTFATRCVEVGFDIKSLSEILGHSSVTITMNRYVHPSMELKKENMEKLTSLINGK